MGWLAPQDAGAFHSLERLLKKHGELAHLTDTGGSFLYAG